MTNIHVRSKLRAFAVVFGALLASLLALNAAPADAQSVSSLAPDLCVVSPTSTTGPGLPPLASPDRPAETVFGNDSGAIIYTKIDVKRVVAIAPQVCDADNASINVRSTTYDPTR